MSAVIEARSLSKWYGNVLGLSEMTLDIEPGITGLLGPNGAGKSTFMKLITGLLKPSRGSVHVLGLDPRTAPEVFLKVGFCPEFDSFYEDMTGWEFLSGMTLLYGCDREAAAGKAMKALETVELAEDRGRRIKGYSRGMRQRLKLAQTMAHDPEVYILDEPLTGLDPLGKRKMIKVVRTLGEAGRTILVSSHVLPEIEALTSRIVLVHQGKILARGDIHYIRDLIDKHPHRVSIICDKPRAVAAAFVGDAGVSRISFGPAAGEVVFETGNRDGFYGRLEAMLVGQAVTVEEISSPDDNLQAVFEYLTGK